jgi:hypothetical protein
MCAGHKRVARCISDLVRLTGDRWRYSLHSTSGAINFDEASNSACRCLNVGFADLVRRAPERGYGCCVTFEPPILGEGATVLVDVEPN